MVGLGEPPWTSASILRGIDPLGPEALRAAFVESDAVFQVSSVPGRAMAGSRAIPQQMQDFALKVRLADSMLSDQPCRLGSVFAGDVFSGPAVFGDQLAEARGMLDMD